MSREIYLSVHIKHRGVIMSKKLLVLLLLAAGSSMYAMPKTAKQEDTTTDGAAAAAAAGAGAAASEVPLDTATGSSAAPAPGAGGKWSRLQTCWASLSSAAGSAKFWAGPRRAAKTAWKPTKSPYVLWPLRAFYGVVGAVVALRLANTTVKSIKTRRAKAKKKADKELATA